MDEKTMTQEIQREASQVVGASRAETSIGVGAAILAILALIGVATYAFYAIAGLALGVALMFEGSGVTNRFLTYLETASNGRVDVQRLRSGASIESLAGLAGIALGILALVGVSPMLVPISAIVYGAAMILGGGVTTSLNTHLLKQTGESESFRQLAGSVMSNYSFLEVIVGIGVVALSILALLVGGNSLVLTLVAFIGVGVMNFIKSFTLGGQLSRSLQATA